MTHKLKIIELLQQGLTYSQIQERTGAAKSTISHHAKRHGLGRGSNPYKIRCCVRCGDEIPKDAIHKRKYCFNCRSAKFTGNCDICGKTLNGRYRCSACMAQVSRFKVKKRAVEYLGGRCRRCGGQFPVAVFDFHHRDPNQKSFGISTRGHCRTWEKIQPELDKCELLCSNCHRLETNYTQVKLESMLG